MIILSFFRSGQDQHHDGRKPIPVFIETILAQARRSLFARTLPWTMSDDSEGRHANAGQKGTEKWLNPSPA
jgi:hypothetical protein